MRLLCVCVCVYLCGCVLCAYICVCVCVCVCMCVLAVCVYSSIFGRFQDVKAIDSKPLPGYSVTSVSERSSEGLGQETFYVVCVCGWLGCSNISNPSHTPITTEGTL